MSLGSFSGNGGCAAYSFKNRQLSTPAMKAPQPRCNQNHCQGKPSGCGTGMMLNERSTQCIAQAQTHSGTMKVKTFFTSILSNARNGMKKWPKMMTMPTQNQVPRSRTTYQKVSSGMLAFQIMKYWAKWIYA